MTGSHAASNGSPMRAAIAVRRAATSRSPAWLRWRARCRGAHEAVALAVRSGKRVVVVSRAESARALDPFGGAFDAVVSDPRELDAALDAILYVSAAEWRRVEARRRGMRAVAPAELGSALAVRVPQSTILAV